MESIDPEILQLVRDHISSQSQITDDKYSSRLPEILAAYNLIQKEIQNQTKSPQSPSGRPDWEINVVACNDSVGRSLCPKAQLNIGEHRVELTAEKVSELRYTVAQLLHRLQHYT